MFARRQFRVRVLEVLERRIKQFRSREELWPLRVPHEPLPFEDLIAEALPDASSQFDPKRLRSRALLALEWDDGSCWEAWVVVLPSGRKVYCDTGADESRVLASGGRNPGDESDRTFLSLLADSAGQHFGIEMYGGAPNRVRSSVTDRDFLVDFFVNLFEGSPAERSIHDGLARVPTSRADRSLDFRSDVDTWLTRTLRT